MVVALGQDQRRPAAVHGVDHVVRDAAIACRIGDEFLIERLELHAPVRIGCPPGAEPGRLHEDEVLERSRGSLGARVHAVATGPHCIVTIG